MMLGETSMRVDRSIKTLRERALENMRAAILSLHFKPGDRLVERDLCDQLAVSRSIVREVLRHLEAEGVVVNVPNKGPIVAKPSPEEARQIYEIRGVLEAMAARACAEKGSPAIAENLAASLDRIRRAYANKAPAEVLAATAEFYRILFEGAGKDIAWTIVSSLHARINHLRAMTIATPGRDVDGPSQMARIVEAIRDGDGEAASQACLAHVRRASELAVELLDRHAVERDEVRAG